MLKKMHSILAVVLSVVLMFSLAGCGKENGGNDVDEENKGGEAKVIDLNGREINLVAWGDGVFNLVEDSEDELGQTYYARMKEMEKEYNCTFVIKKVGAAEILPGLRAAEMGGTSYADVVVLRQAWAKSARDEGILLDLSQLFDGSLEQFYQPAVNCLKDKDGKFYSIAFYKENPVENLFIFNRDHFENQGIDVDALYQEVLDGKWTFERLFEIAEKATVEKNGKIEVYGTEVCTAGDALGNFLAPFGAQMMVENEDGTYSSGLKTDNMQDALKKLSDMWSSKHFWKKSGSDAWDANIQSFTSGTLAMINYPIASIGSLSQTVPFKIGVLPMPKNRVEDEYTYSAMTLNVAVMPASMGNDMETAQAIADMITYIYAPIDENVESTLTRKYSMYSSDEKMVRVLVEAALSDNFVFSNHIYTGLKSTYENICSLKISDILKGNVSIKAGLDAINDAWQASIDEYNAGLK